MPSVYGPFASDVETQHRNSLRHAYSAIAYPRYGDPIELDVEDCSIQFHGAWRPYVSADLTIKAFEDQESMDALDPRNGCRVQIFTGYIYDGFVEDIHLMANLHLRTRSVDRPGNTIKLTLVSDELLAEDYKRVLGTAGGPKFTGVNELVQYYANLASTPDTATVVSEFPPNYGTAELADMQQQFGQDALSMLVDVEERLDVRIYCDGDRTWRIEGPKEYVGTSALKLFYGAGGTLIDTSTVLTRGETLNTGFANAVGIKYTWQDPTLGTLTGGGYAYVSSGPWAVSAIGWNVHYEERDYYIASPTLANQAAANVLRRLVGRGHQMTITAHAAYWIRAGHTVTVQLPVGGQQRYLVSQVSFNPVAGTMDLALFQPTNVTISTTGG